MDLSDDEKKIQEEAIDYIKSKKSELIDKFVIQKKPLRLALFSFFMAGSPGAGKTEFARRYMPVVFNGDNEELVKILKRSQKNISDFDEIFIKIDVDEIRNFLPQYRKTTVQNSQKGNAHVIQKAATIGLDYIRDYCLENDISFIHDGTFGNYGTMEQIIKKSLAKQRIVQIIYIYLDPITAWEYTKARELEEGRNIQKDKFIDQFFKSRENVDKIKEKFNGKVTIHCIIKNKENKIAETHLYESSVASLLKIKYDNGSLINYSPEDLSYLLR